MDVNDLKDIKIPELEAEPYTQIWNLQLELLQDYKKIEKLPEWPVQLDLRASQTLLKDFIGRVVEELAEADEHQRHSRTALFKEELADALHFLTETLIFVMPLEEVYTRAKLFTYWDKAKDFISVCQLEPGRGHSLQIWFWETTYHLKLAANALKNKPWKQTEMRAQSTIFKDHLIRALIVFLEGYHMVGMRKKEIFEEYYKKNQINRFRINSKY